MNKENFKSMSHDNKINMIALEIETAPCYIKNCAGRLTILYRNMGLDDWYDDAIYILSHTDDNSYYDAVNEVCQKHTIHNQCLFLNVVDYLRYLLST